METWSIILDLLLLLSGALVLGLLFEKLRQNAIIGYLVAGILLGPPVLNLISNKAVITGTAELGITLLLFMIGLEFSWKRIRAMGAAAIGSGVLQIVVTSAAITLICIGFGLDLRASIAIGAILTPSSTALVLRLLADRGEMESMHGRLSLGILLLQDIAIVPLVLLISELGNESSLIGILGDMGRSILLIGLLFSGLYLFNRYVLTRVLDMSAGSRNSELLLILAVLMPVGSAWTAHRFGVSPSLGAFVAGMLLAESPFAVQIRADLGALRTLFMTLFFASVGMLANTGWIISNWPIALGVLAAMIVGKALIVWLITWKLIGSRRHALATGLSIAQAGEFSFLLASVALGGGILDHHLYQLVVSVTLLSLIPAPYLVSNASSIAGFVEKAISRSKRRMPDASDDSRDSARQSGHVVIIGFGPSGRGVWLAMEREGIPSTLVELNPRTVAEALNLGITVIFGDATHEEVLRKAGLERASLAAVTLPDPQTSLQVIRQIRATASHVPIAARARYHIFADDLASAGAEIVIDEEQEIGSLLSEEIVKRVRDGGEKIQFRGS